MIDESIRLEFYQLSSNPNLGKTLQKPPFVVQAYIETLYSEFN